MARGRPTCRTQSDAVRPQALARST
jgi:hypothetical protein